MATPRVTIDALPEQGTAEDTNYLIVQDDGVTKKMSMTTLKNVTSTPLANHIAATIDAHDATAVSALPAGTGVDSPTVQGQLSQLATLVDGAASIGETDARYVQLAGSTMTGPLVLPGAPTADLQAATKLYVDDAVSDATGGGLTEAQADLLYVNVGGDTMTGPLVLAADPANPLEAATKQYADNFMTEAQADGRYVNNWGDTMTGDLTLPGDPTMALHAAPKQYVDRHMLKSGDTATGPLLLTGQGTDPDNAATRQVATDLATFIAQEKANGTVITPTFSTGWSSMAGYQPCQVTKIGNMCYMTAMTQRTGAQFTSGTFLTLPVGYRPALQALFPAMVNSGVMGRVEVTPAGSVTLHSFPAVTVAASTGWIAAIGFWRV
jgi:hypothetical protein